jgi:hypothetical protein
VEGAGVVAGGPPGAPGGSEGGKLRSREIIVTAPLRASSLPPVDTPALVEIEVKARIFPSKMVPAPRVAELPTCQKMFAAWALLMVRTSLELAVVSVLPI